MKKTTKMAVVLAAMSVMVLGAATMVSADEKNGWAKEGSDWYYYVNDEAVKNQWALSGEQWYFLDDEGKMATDVFVDNSIPEVVDVRNHDTRFDANEVLYGDIYDYYYVDENGAMVTEWKNIKRLDEVTPVEGEGKAWFYFGANGVMYANTWVLSDDVWYFLGDNGRMKSNHLLTTWDNNEYFLNKDGAMVTGWYKTREDNTSVGGKGVWIYADKNGVLASDEWQKVNGNWYYFGATTKGSVVSDGAINNDLEPVSSPFTMESEGFVEVQRVRSTDVDMFYLTKSGAMETGLFKVSSVEDNQRFTDYYFANKNGVIQKGVQEVSGRYYFFELDDATRFDDNTKGANNYAIKELVLDSKGEKVVTAEYTVYQKNDAAAKKIAGKDAITEIYYEVYKLGTATMWK